MNAGKPLKAHLERALAILKSVNESQIGVRIFYQAGELEVDLATPDGKPYTPPKPAEEEKKKTKKKFDPFSPQHIERRQWR